MKIETRIKRAFMNRYDIKAQIKEGVVTAKGFMPTRIEEWSIDKTESGSIRLLCLGNCFFKFGPDK